MPLFAAPAPKSCLGAQPIPGVGSGGNGAVLGAGAAVGDVVVAAEGCVEPGEFADRGLADADGAGEDDDFAGRACLAAAFFRAGWSCGSRSTPSALGSSPA